MADFPTGRRGSIPSTVPLKRPHELDDEPPQRYAPAVSSPLNPDFATVRARKAAPPPPSSSATPAPAAAREPREKKESLKKREAKGAVEGGAGGHGSAARAATPDAAAPAGGGSGASGGGGGGKAGKGGKKGVTEPAPAAQGIIRYTIPPPKAHDFEPAGPPLLVQGLQRAGQQFYVAQEHVFNRKGFRYTHCVAEPDFPSIQYHRLSEVAPFGPRFDYEDSSSHIQFDADARAVTTEKGFRMARANVGVREGRWYWECRVLSGVPGATAAAAQSDSGGGGGGGSGGHVRFGFSRREASLDTPVGFDAYSYGLRDQCGQRVHRSRPEPFFPANESVREGDVVGFEINLPSLALHRKVVEGTYNKAVDVADDAEPPGPESCNIIRDRIPIRYKSSLYFEQFECQATKEMEELLHPPATAAAATGAASQAPHPNHPHTTLRTLPFSYIKVFKNGRPMGTPYSDLFAFLPPASRPAPAVGGIGGREGLDDGSLGYYPSVSVFHGGAARANFGPDFEFPPPDLACGAGDGAGDDDDVDMVGEAAPEEPAAAAAAAAAAGPARRIRPLCERYAEQIAEDVLYDILDETDMWMQDQAALGAASGAVSAPPSVARPAPAALAGSAATSVAAVTANGHTGELNEIVQDDE